MKALGYFKPHDLNQFSIETVDVPTPTARANDLVVRVRAISVNPVDYKIRQSRAATDQRGQT
jgi:NADPH2:quinone reductase